MAKGDHIYVRRALGYTHHGIDCGDGTVIHFNGEPLKKTAASIARTPMAEFTGGARVRTRIYGNMDRPEVTMDRAESRVGIQGYNLVFNNCEHFATWCCTGEFKSRQVRNVVRSGRGAASAAAAAGVGPPTALLVGAAASVFGVYRAARRLPSLRRK
jgi:hypothetical protein